MRFFVPVTFFAALATAGSSVDLTGDNFESITHIGANHTGSDTAPWFIKFYAPWCGHCKKMAPTWEELVDVVGDIAHIGSVDSTTERGLAKRFGIRGFPTLLFFANDQVVKYKGPRKLENLEAFVRGGWQERDADDVPPAEQADKSLRKQSHRGWFW